VGLSPVTATFAVQTSGCSVADWYAQITGRGMFAFLDLSGPQETFNPDLLANTTAGTHNVVLTVANADYASTERSMAAAFSLTRRTAWSAGSVNASPEPVTKGKPIRVKGKLARADWEHSTYAGYGGRSVSVQFRAAGASSWATVKTATTSSTGWVDTTVSAVRDGTWRLSYAGNSAAGAATSVGDYVDVR